MEVTPLCIRLTVNILMLLTAHNGYCAHKADAAVLRLNPNKRQFFNFESILFNCVESHGPAEWRVATNVSLNAAQWETSTGSLKITAAEVAHSGEYWCENRNGERSNSVNITVTAGSVILESPAHPVKEQQNVTLRCRRRTSPSNSPADFYKDGRFIETGYTGTMTIKKVSKSNEGLYKCRVSGPQEDSAESWLAIGGPHDTASEVGNDTTSRDRDEALHPPQAGSSQLSIVLPIIFTILFVAVLLVLGLWWRKHRGSEDAVESVYVNVPRCKEKVSSNAEGARANRTKHRKEQGHWETAK